METCSKPLQLQGFCDIMLALRKKHACRFSGVVPRKALGFNGRQTDMRKKLTKKEKTQ